MASRRASRSHPLRGSAFTTRRGDLDAEEGPAAPSSLPVSTGGEDSGGESRVASAIAYCEVNISDCSVQKTEDQRAQICFAIDIFDPKDLEKLIGEARKIRSVFNVRQVVGQLRKLGVVARTDIDKGGRKWAELRNGEKFDPDLTSYRNLTIEAEEMVARD